MAFILPGVAPDGYSGNIALIVGVDIAGNISGVRVTAHKETPGLGDKIDLKKHDWILGFNGLSLGNPPAGQWAVRKDGGQFDAFTGATITPRAVVGQIARMLEYFMSHREQLIDLSQEPLPNAEEVE